MRLCDDEAVHLCVVTMALVCRWQLRHWVEHCGTHCQGVSWTPILAPTQRSCKLLVFHLCTAVSNASNTTYFVNKHGTRRTEAQTLRRVPAAKKCRSRRALTFSVLQEGGKLVLVARTQEKLDKAAQQLKADHGTDVLTISADTDTTQGNRDMIRKAVNTFGRLDAVYLNAGALWATGPCSWRTSMSHIVTLPSSQLVAARNTGLMYALTQQFNVTKA
jgi:short chain dehydrogenase